MKENLIYTSPDCQACHMTKYLFEQQGTSYREIDVSIDKKAYETLQAAGHKSLPVVVTSNGVWTGFRPEKIRGIGHGKT
jgi:glutaredoxin-like protein NrdH